jgi:hypothetical protein
MKFYRKPFICSACLFSGCDGASILFKDKSPANLKFAASFKKGEKIPIADPAFAPRSINGVLVSLGIVMEVMDWS